MSDDLDGGLEQETMGAACDYLHETDAQLGEISGDHDYHGAASEYFCPDAGSPDASADAGVSRNDGGSDGAY